MIIFGFASSFLYAVLSLFAIATSVSSEKKFSQQRYNQVNSELLAVEVKIAELMGKAATATGTDLEALMQRIDESETEKKHLLRHLQLLRDLAHNENVATQIEARQRQQVNISAERTFIKSHSTAVSCPECGSDSTLVRDQPTIYGTDRHLWDFACANPNIFDCGARFHVEGSAIEALMKTGATARRTPRKNRVRFTDGPTSTFRSYGTL